MTKGRKASSEREEGREGARSTAARLLVSQEMMRQPAQARGELDEWVISLTLSGRVHYQIGKDRFIGVTGDLMVIRPMARQHWQIKSAPDGSPGHWHVVYAAFGPTAEMLRWLDFPMTQEGYFLTSLRNLPGVQRRVAGALRRARKLNSSRLAFGRELTQQALGEALIWVRAGLEGTGVGKPGPAMDMRVHRALEYMNNRVHEPVTLEEIARAAAASRSQLSLVFAQQMGVPVMRYFEQLRMDRAGQMLRMTTHSIKQVGRAVGYEDPKYFVKRFRGVMGVTPRVFRMRKEG